MTTFEPDHGSIVHVELYSEDADATRAFFATVFDWAFEAVEGMDYTTFRAPSPPHGGLLTREPGDFTPPDALVYVNVDDLASTSGSVRDAGGRVVVDETEVPGMGAFVVFEAPGGVVQAAWETHTTDEATDWDLPTDDPEPGSLVHVELYSADPDATQSFYGDVFDWTFEDVGEGEYTLVRPPTPPNGGLLAAGEHRPPGTLTYLLVDDAVETCASIEAAGGAVVREPFDVGGWGTMAVFADPAGVEVALWESEGD